MNKVFCISAGQSITKKTNTIINRKNRYLNYGLLSLTTLLKKSGWDAFQIQGLFDAPSETINKCIDFGFDRLSVLPILISIPSFYAISWVNEFILSIKEINPYVKIIIGGRWVIADRCDLMRSIVPNADVIIPGLADKSIIDIFESCLRADEFKIKRRHFNEGGPLNYDLLYERELYQPSLEVSRGCGMGCSFCQEKDEPLQSLKSPKIIIDEAKSIIISDDLHKMNLYFESSMFIPSKFWVESIIKYREEESLNFSWRSESRVDTINLKLVRLLAKSGLKILDLGLESASETQLIKMKKTKNVKLYLERASKLLKECYLNGIMVKVNILLFAGETEKTISETVKWLELHRKYIKGVSVGPVIVFGWESESKEYIKELQNYGASVSHSPTIGVQSLNLSNEINYEESTSISKSISQEFMSPEDYFFLKSFSYFSRDYTYKNYQNDLYLDSTNTGQMKAPGHIWTLLGCQTN